MIFAAIAVAWMAYLVPHFARRREGDPVETEVETPAMDRFSDSMRIIRHGTAPLLDQDLTEIGTFEVSTPLTRFAAIRELKRLEAVAANRRRRVLLLLLAALSLTVGVCGADLLPWWATGVTGGLLVGFVVLARLSVRAMRRSLNTRFASIDQGGAEKTVFLSRAEIKAAVGLDAAKSTVVEPTKAGTLWDPVPITMPTYVSKPLAPRTVRTIDLSGPGVTSSARRPGPVVADAEAPESTTPPASAAEDQAEAASA